MTNFQEIYSPERGNQISSSSLIPTSPITSRFVSPWDTAGWYTVTCNFKAGAKIYSNAPVHINTIDEEFLGVDYIQTFDSKQDNFIDHPGLDFYVELDTHVYVALDEDCKPDWLKDWKDTNKSFVSTDKIKYLVYSKEYKCGDLVHVPGFESDHHHYFVLVKPLSNSEETKSLPLIKPLKSKLDKFVERPYTHYIKEVFNDKSDAIFAHDYIPYGCARVVEDTKDKRNKYLLLEATDKSDIASVTKGIGQNLIYPFIFQCKVKLSQNSSLSLVMDKEKNPKAPMVTFGSDGKIYTNTNKEDIGTFDFKQETLVKLKVNPEKKTYEIWINHVKEKDNIPFDFDSIDTFMIYLQDTSDEGFAEIDNIELFDDTEIYLVEEKFEEDKLSNWTSSQDLKVEDYPFKEDRSLVLEGLDDSNYSVHQFNPVDKLVSIETKVKVKDNKFSLAPQIFDKDGKSILKVALYKNNLYASNGDKWLRIYEGLTPWMYYPCNNWFNIKVTIDIEKQSYDLFVDGAKRASDFAFENKVNNVAQVGFSVQKDSRLYINRIRVYDCADFSRGVLAKTKIFDVKAPPYNAIGDGITLETKKIQKAIDDAAYTGGTVYIHSGTFFTGNLELKTDMTLFIDKSATILGTQDHSHYKLRSPGISLCAVRQLGRGLIYGENISNVQVTGGGMLDGNGTYRYKMNDPLHNREEDARPDIIYITYSKDLTIENLNMKSSPFWTVVPLSSHNIVIRNLNLDCMNTPNRDGIDPVDCYNITLYNCNIMAGDDGLCFKTSDNIGCYNIDAYDMMIQSLASGIKFGTDTYYSLKDAHFRDCAIKNVNRCGVSLETVDGAEVDNVLFERLDMTDVGAPIYVTIGKRNRLPRGNQPVRWSSMKNVTFKDIRFEEPYPFSYEQEIRENMVIGQGPDQLIENLKFINFDLKLPGGVTKMPDPPVTIDDKYPEYDRHGLSSGYAFTIKYAKNIEFENLKVKLDAPDIRPEVAYFDFSGSLKNKE